MGEKLRGVLRERIKSPFILFWCQRHGANKGVWTTNVFVERVSKLQAIITLGKRSKAKHILKFSCNVHEAQLKDGRALSV